MKKIITHFTLPLLALFGLSSGVSVAQNPGKNVETGTLETLIVARGTVVMAVDVNRLNGASSKEARMETLRFQAMDESFFPILVFNNELRGPKLGVMALTGQDSPSLPASLRESYSRLVIEKVDSSAGYDIVVRDGKTGFVFFSVEGHQYAYDAKAKSLQVTDGRLVISDAFAKNIGRPADAGAVVGNISIAATMRPIEVSKVVNGEVESSVMPASGTIPGPDVIVGDVSGLAQFGSSSGTQVGLAVGTDSCNFGVENLHWFQNPDNDHPVIPQNLYRMSGGTANTDRFEQVGQSSVKHAFTALTNNICGLGCNGVGGTNLGSGCSDPYSASLNSGPTLGSRAWINPFTGAYPRNDSATPNNSHSGHTHTGPSHRILTEIADLNTALNPGATYYAEGQYVTRHEYDWCSTHPGQCNMNNNVSYRQYSVTGTGSPFSFSSVGSTQRQKAAIRAWTGATFVDIAPDSANDGIGVVAYKVTNPSAGVWHYEYAIYNQNLDRAIQSFSVPLGCGITASNLGFHAPPQHPGWTADGTVGNTGYSSTPWASNQTLNALTWNSETLAQNPNANAIRWGTLYNFRFDSNKPPVTTNATVGFYKTGAPIMVAIQAPTPDVCNPFQMSGVVSRKVHGLAGTFDIDISSGAAVECRSGGANGDHTFVFTFSNNVVSGNAAVTLGAGSVAGSPSFSGNTMTVNLTGVTDIQKITVNLSGVTDQFAQTLPSAGVSVNMLLGDTNGNKSVNGSDVSQTKAASGVTLDATNFRTDVNVTGGVTGSDISQVKSVVGHSLP